MLTYIASPCIKPHINDIKVIITEIVPVLIFLSIYFVSALFCCRPHPSNDLLAYITFTCNSSNVCIGYQHGCPDDFVFTSVGASFMSLKYIVQVANAYTNYNLFISFVCLMYFCYKLYFRSRILAS